MLDTNIVSELARNPHGAIANRIAEVGPDGICVSIIVAAELVEAPVEAPEFDEETIAAFVDQEGFELPSEELDGEAEQGSPVPEQRTTENLDEGLNGERGAIPGAVVWLILATKGT